MPRPRCNDATLQGCAWLGSDRASPRLSGLVKMKGVSRAQVARKNHNSTYKNDANATYTRFVPQSYIYIYRLLAPLRVPTFWWVWQCPAVRLASAKCATTRNAAFGFDETRANPHAPSWALAEPTPLGREVGSQTRFCQMGSLVFLPPPNVLFWEHPWWNPKNGDQKPKNLTKNSPGPCDQNTRTQAANSPQTPQNTPWRKS